VNAAAARPPVTASRVPLAVGSRVTPRAASRRCSGRLRLGGVASSSIASGSPGSWRALTGAGNASRLTRAPVSLNGANAVSGLAASVARTWSGERNAKLPLTRCPVAVALGSRTVSAAAVAVEVTVAATLAA